jgi:hypothetical protein
MIPEQYKDNHAPEITQNAPEEQIVSLKDTGLVYGPMGKEFETQKGQEMARDHGMNWKELSAVQHSELAKCVIYNPETQKGIVGGSSITLYIGTVVTPNPEDFAENVQAAI